MSRYVQWSKRERSGERRIAVTASLAPVFLGVLPLAVAGVGPRLDRRLGLPRPAGRRASGVLGLTLAAAGFVLGFWSVYTQLDRGRGTPLPTMPTHELLTSGPFGYCRNPMTLGTILAYLGIGVAARTTAGIGLVLALAAALLTYLKRLEEPELAERFGESYVAYRQTTPFIVPRLSKPR